METTLPHKQRFSRLSIIIVVVVVILIVVLLWHHHSETQQTAAAARRSAQAAVTVTTTAASKGDIPEYLDAIGTVTPVNTVSITSQVNGPVVDVHFKEGQQVRKGDPLLEIDSRPYRATLLQAQGILERDQSILAQARMDLERYRAALARNAVAQQIVDDQEKLVLQDQGTLKNDEGTVQYDRIQVGYCDIASPISGQIGLRLVDPGNVVQASGTTVLAVVTQLQPITVISTLPEDALSPVLDRLRDKATLTVDAFDRTAQRKIASGQLLALDNQIDITTGTVKVRATFDNKDSALFPNQFVNTRLLVNTLQGVTLLPASAVQQNGQSAFVYLIQDNVAHQRTVKPGITNAGITQVDGINPGDVVANSSFDKLQDNAHIQVQAPAQPAGQVQPPPQSAH